MSCFFLFLSFVFCCGWHTTLLPYFSLDALSGCLQFSINETPRMGRYACGARDYAGHGGLQTSP